MYMNMLSLNAFNSAIAKQITFTLQFALGRSADKQESVVLTVLLMCNASKTKSPSDLHFHVLSSALYDLYYVSAQ